MKVAQSCPTLCDPMDYTVHGIFQARILEWAVFPFSRGSYQTQSPALQVDSLPTEPQGKPKNIGVGSLSLPQADSLPTELSGSPNRNVNFCLIQILSNFPEGDDSIPFGLILVHMTFLSVACVSFGHNLEPSLGLRFLSLI